MRNFSRFLLDRAALLIDSACPSSSTTNAIAELLFLPNRSSKGRPRYVLVLFVPSIPPLSPPSQPFPTFVARPPFLSFFMSPSPLRLLRSRWRRSLLAMVLFVAHDGVVLRSSFVVLLYCPLTFFVPYCSLVILANLALQALHRADTNNDHLVQRCLNLEAVSNYSLLFHKQ